MKKLFIALLIVFGLQMHSQEKIILPEGTLIRARLNTEINGRDVNTGDKIEFELLQNLVIDNRFFIAEFGSKIIGTVTDAKGSRMLGKKGKLEFTIDYLYLKNGEVVKLTSQNKKNLQGSGVGVAATAILFTPFTLFLHGHNAKYKSGTEFECYVSHDTPVTPMVLSK